MLCSRQVFLRVGELISTILKDFHCKMSNESRVLLHICSSLGLSTDSCGGLNALSLLQILVMYTMADRRFVVVCIMAVIKKQYLFVCWLLTCDSHSSCNMCVCMLVVWLICDSLSSCDMCVCVRVLVIHWLGWQASNGRPDCWGRTTFKGHLWIKSRVSCHRPWYIKRLWYLYPIACTKVFHVLFGPMLAHLIMFE